MDLPGSSSPGHHRRSLSAPLRLDSLADAALAAVPQHAPSSLSLDIGSLEDEVSLSLRNLLLDTQRELAEAVAAGVLQGAAAGDGDDAGLSGVCGRGGDGHAGASTGVEPGPCLRQQPHYASDSAAEGGSDGEEGAAAAAAAAAGQHRRSGGADASVSAGQEAEAELELELAGLSSREREAAIRRAKNREAARRSRERKMERISGLQTEVEQLQANNFVLLRCIEEVTRRALGARAEQRQLQERIALLTAQKQQQRAAGLVPAAAAAAAGGAGAWTPPPARRAAALERELVLMESEPPRSPTTQLQLLPLWPCPVSSDDKAPAAPRPPPEPLPTSAELRRQLREALAGTCSSDGDGGCGIGTAAAAVGSAAAGGDQQAQGYAAPQQQQTGAASVAADQHLLQPSPLPTGRSLPDQQEQQAQQQQQQLMMTAPWLLQQQQQAGGPQRAASAPAVWFQGVPV